MLNEVISRLLGGEIDILTGTQMIAKGLDASRVTLVGVLNAGIGLGLPDFRANERVFSLLTQVAGRAGRSKLKGEVLIETNTPNHPVIQMAMNQNYIQFYESEIPVRKELFYPPFSRLIRIVSRSKDEQISLETIELVFGILKKFFLLKIRFYSDRLLVLFIKSILILEIISFSKLLRQTFGEKFLKKKFAL
ncbi:helicase C-terminal domain protein [Leptospira interrogans serovar Bataviae str. HAI135]|nr:helicase C-terminal domain protein [Leptospira interrogans serovar Bataviae str. HAI135]